jgi:hypothetical protein
MRYNKNGRVLACQRFMANPGRTRQWVPLRGSIVDHVHAIPCNVELPRFRIEFLGNLTNKEYGRVFKRCYSCDDGRKSAEPFDARAL